MLQQVGPRVNRVTMGTVYQGLGHGIDSCLEKLESLTLTGSPPFTANRQEPISLLNHETFKISSEQAKKRRVRPEHPEYRDKNPKAVNQVPKELTSRSKNSREKKKTTRPAQSGDQTETMNVDPRNPGFKTATHRDPYVPALKMQNPINYNAPMFIYDMPRIPTPRVQAPPPLSRTKAATKHEKLIENLSPCKPVPHASYIAQASKPAKVSRTRQPLLVVSDLNGTILSRVTKNTFETRPGLPSFLAPFFGRERVKHRFMVWTSMMPDRTINLTDKLLTAAERRDTVAIWARDKLNLSAAQYAEDVLVYKNLDWIWRDPQIQSTHPHTAQGVRWDQTNTLLIDDTISKAAAQPYNLINVPELTLEQLRREEDGAYMPVLRQLAWYLEEASYHEDVSAFVKSKPFVAHEMWQKGRDHHELRSQGLPCSCCVVFYKS